MVILLIEIIKFFIICDRVVLDLENVQMPSKFVDKILWDKKYLGSNFHFHYLLNTVIWKYKKIENHAKM